jgi:hypothetical protein
MKNFILLPLLFLSACNTTFPFKQEKTEPAFDPATYGTQAMIAMLHDPERSEADALLAVEEIMKRRMGVEDGLFLMRAVQVQPSSKVKLEILTAIGTLRLAYLYPELMEYVPETQDPQLATRALDAAVAVMKDDRLLHKDLSRLLLTAELPAVRARAGMQLTKRFPFETEPVFLLALETEESATVAAMMTEFLAVKGTKASLPVLEAISNAIDRTYVEDDFLGKKFNAAAVRGGAVQGVQRLRAE